MNLNDQIKKVNKIDVLIFLILSLLWISMSQLVNPVGDFPLDDDWNSGLTVYHLVKTGEYKITPWLSSSLIAQAFWGALFCIPYGFSFTFLRVSTLILALIGVFFVYGILRQTKTSRVIASIGATLVMINPLFFVLSYTFRTDIPFFAMAMGSLFFFINFIEKKRKTEFMLAIIFSVLSVLIRQVGLVIPTAFFIIYICSEKINLKAVMQALLPICFAIFSLVIYQQWLNFSLGLSTKRNPTLSRFIDNIFSAGIEHFVVMIGVIIIYLGIFIFPFFILTIGKIYRVYSKNDKRVSLLITIICFLGIMAILVVRNNYMPLWGNTLFDLGLGPLTLRDTFILGLPHWPRAHVSIWIFITVLAVFGASLFLQVFVIRIKQILFNEDTDKDRKIVLLLCMLIGIFYTVLIVIAGIFDRYVVFLIPITMVIIIAGKDNNYIPKKKVLNVIVGLLAAIYIAFAIAGTHDYLSWNRARWNSIRYLLLERNVPVTKIDGGYEFNGWYTYDPNYKKSPDKSWWWVKGDEYIISFGSIRGYKIIGKFQFQRWLCGKVAYIYILNKM